jgi:3',5'-cyclic-AMP phosphodiesterase
MYFEMFGDFNFVLEYNNCRLVFFDDNIWERNVQDPDFEWLAQNLSNGDQYTHQFVFAHIPPWSQPFSIGNRLLYNYIMETNNVTASIHGHTHTFSYTKPFGDIPYLVTGDSQDREIVVLEVLSDTILVDRKTILKFGRIK